MRVSRLALVLFAAVPATLSADTVVLEPALDNTLYEDPSGGLSNGIGTRMFSGRTNQPSGFRRRAVLQFDVAAQVPAGATIQSVTLTLAVVQTTAGSAHAFALHRVLAGWEEGTSLATRDGQGGGGAAGPGSVTWIHRSHDDLFWASPGGDFQAQASASASVAGSGSKPAWTGGSLAGDVQGWLDDPGTNHGWVLLGPESSAQTARAFATGEASAASRPKLTIDFQPMVPVEPATWGRIKSARAPMIGGP